jgi:hypothetical protein
MNLRQWVLKQSAIYKEMIEYEDFNDEIKICTGVTSGVHVYEGLEDMAIAVGADLYINRLGRVAFKYNNVEFFQLG